MEAVVEAVAVMEVGMAAVAMEVEELAEQQR